jgi:integrase
MQRTALATRDASQPTAQRAKRERKKLTPIFIAKGLTKHIRDCGCDPDAERFEMPDQGCEGLYLVRQPSAAMSWVYRYRSPISGKPVKFTVAEVRLLPDGEPEPSADAPTADAKALTLKQARRAVERHRDSVASGVDPAEARKQAAQQALQIGHAHDFDVLAKRFLTEHTARKRPSTYKDRSNVLGFVIGADGELQLRSEDAKPRGDWPGRKLATWPAPRWRGRKVQTLKRADVRELRDAIFKTSEQASGTTLSVLKALFAWIIRETDDLIEASPADHVDKKEPFAVRDRVLSDGELRLIWRGADAISQPSGDDARSMASPLGPLVKLLLLSGCRRQEWAGARWVEIDRPAGVFKLPKERAKNGLAHLVPLTPQALKVLESLGGQSEFLFSTGQGRSRPQSDDAPDVPISGFSAMRKRLDAAMLRIARQDAQEAGADPDQVRPIPPWRLHDLRRTCATGWQRLKVAEEVRRSLMNHKKPGVGAHYDHHDHWDERREALALWAEEVARIVGGPGAPSNDTAEAPAPAAALEMIAG